MDVYRERLLVSAFPVTLPKLCLAVGALTSAAKPFTKLVLRVLNVGAGQELIKFRIVYRLPTDHGRTGRK